VLKVCIFLDFNTISVDNCVKGQNPEKAMVPAFENNASRPDAGRQNGGFHMKKVLSLVLAAVLAASLSACGGILTMAAGFRVSRIKSVPLVDLMPALILVMPFSMLWTALMG